MNKQQFITQLREKISGLPQSDIEERIMFYSEMIDDKVEEGMSQEEAISQMGSIDDIASQIVSDIPLSKIVKEKIKSKQGLKTWQIILLVLGSPIWASILIAIIATIFSVYISLWVIIISLWAAFVAFIGGTVIGIASGIMSLIQGAVPEGILTLGAVVTLIGLTILMFFVCKLTTKGILLLTKKITFIIKKCFARKEEAK